MREAGGTGRCFGRPILGSGVGSRDRELERRSASRGGAHKTAGSCTTRGDAQGATPLQASGEGIWTSELEAVSDSAGQRIQSLPRGRTPRRQRRRSRQGRRKRKRKRKERSLEEAGRAGERTSRGSQQRRLSQTHTWTPTRAYGAVDRSAGSGTGSDLNRPTNSPSEDPSVVEICDTEEAAEENFTSLSELGAGPMTGPVQPASTPELTAFSRPEDLGLQLVEGLHHGITPKGMECLLEMVKHNASLDASSRYRGVFPLPVDWNLLSSVENPRAAPGVQAWRQLICHALNSLSGCKKIAPKSRSGPQVTRVLKNLEKRIEKFFTLFSKPCEPLSAEAVWEDVTSKKVSYSGEELAEPVLLSKNQILKSLPPLGHGGSVDLIPFLEGKTRHLLLNPKEVLLGAGERIPGSNRARVHIAPGEGLSVWKLLEERGVIDWLPLEDVHVDAGGPFLSGLFGVPKPGKFTESGDPLLRVIMNLKPINRALKIIKGDIDQLPSPTAWTQIHLGEGETLQVSQADMSSAFYLFKLPPQWRPFLAFNAKFQGQEVGKEAGKWYVPTCIVLPMGWSSSVGVMQMVSRELVRRKDLGTAEELRKQALVPRWFVDAALRCGPLSFWQVYLDNFMAGELSAAETQEGLSQELHRTATQAWDEAGVLCAEDKHVLDASDAIELGVQLHSKAGLVGADQVRIQKVIVATLKLLEQNLPKVKWVQVVLGRWVFILQYRRPAMAVLAKCWNYCKEGEDRRRWWPIVRKELTLLLCLVPLLHTDVTTRFVPEVTCSDASQFGGAAATSVSLTSAGHQVANRLRDITMEPVEIPVLVVSAFNGRIL